MVHILKLLIFFWLILSLFGFALAEEITSESTYNSTGETPFYTQAGWLWGPGNFEECISQNMKGVSSELGAKAIMMACIRLFPRDKNSTPISSTDKRFYNCLLKDLKGVGNDLAAKLAIANCQQKHQKH